MSDGEGGEDITPKEIVTDGYLRTDSLDEQLSVHVIDIRIDGCSVFTCWIYYGRSSRRGRNSLIRAIPNT